MKYTLAASFAMAALVGAAPVNNKRDLVYSTTTVDEWVTVWSTTTVWEGEATPAAAAATSVGGFYESQSSSIPSSAPAPSTRVSSASSSYSTPAAPIVPSSTPAAPVVPSSTPAAKIVQSSTSTSTTPSSTPVYVAPTSTLTPTSTYVAPVVVPTTTAVPTTTSAYVAPVASTTQAAAVPVVATSSSTTTGTSTGDMTYYDVSVGLTSCGETGSNSDFLVAMNKPDMANGVNPNLNPHCNQYINIYFNGVGPIKGKVVDTCPECVSGAIDVTDSLFKAVAPTGDGRVHGVSWSWA